MLRSVKNKIKNDEIDRKKDFNNKIKRHRIGAYIGKIFIVVVIIIIIGTISYNWERSTYTTYEVKNTIERLGSSGAYYESLNGNILMYSKDGIGCIDAKGRAMWNQTYGMQNPMVASAGDMVVVGDYNGNILHVIDEKGDANEINTNLPIKKLTISEKGIVACVLDDGEVTWIHVYDKNGNKLAFEKSTMKITGYPMDVAFSGEMMGVSYLYVDSGTIKSNVTFYNFGEVGQNNLDKIVSSYTYMDTIVPKISFMNDATAFAVADNRIMFYRGAQKPVHQAERLIDKEIQDIYYGENYVALVFFDETGQHQYQIDVFNDDGKMINTIYTDMEYNKMIFVEEHLLIHNENECQLIGVDGNIKYEGVFEEDIKAIVPIGGINKYLLLTNHSIDTIKLQ